MKRLFLILLLLTIPLYATDYYIKTGGNDGSAGTSDGTAWATIGKVNTEFGNSTFNAGDNIYFNRGDTWTDAVLTITTGGSGGTYLTIGAYGSGNKPVFDCQATRLNAVKCDSASVDYVRVQDIKCIDSSANAFVFSSQARTNIILSRLEVDGTENNSGIYLDKVDTYTIEDCIIENPANSGIVIYGSASDAITNGIIEGNFVDCGGDNSDDGITIHRDGSLNDAGANHVLLDNVCINATEEGFDITSGSDIVLRGNETYGNGAGSIMVGNVNTDRVFIEDHYAHDLHGEGIILGTTSTHVVVSISKVWNVDDRCVLTTCADVYVANCTLIGTASGGNVKFDLGDSSSTVVVRNCIMTSTNSGATTYVRYTGSATPANTSSDFDYNYWWNPDGDNTVIRWNGHNWADWQGTDSQGANSTFADPKIVSASTPNFTLQGTSPCINAGTWLTTITSANGSGTSFVVSDAKWFHDGLGLADGSEIQLEGDTSSVTVTDVNYGTNTITVDESVAWTQGDGVAFQYSDSAPDVGAEEYSSASSEHKTVLKSGVKLVLGPGVKVVIE